MTKHKQEIKDTRIHLCLDCGKCTVVCPIARYDPNFNPRLIVQRNIEQKNRNYEDDSIWSCLNCYMCLERCNYRVEFPEFIRILRTEALSEGTQGQCSHGGTLQSVMHLMAGEKFKQQRLNWLPRDIELSPQTDTIFFTGCAPYFDVMFKDLGVNTLDGVKSVLRLLNRSDMPFNLLADELCCGRDLLIEGDRTGFMSLAEANLREFERLGVKKIITGCPECYYALKVDYPRILGKTVAEVVYWTEAVAPLLDSGELKLGKLKKKVTYQDPCTLGRGLRIFESPRKILNAVNGLELVEMQPNREAALCCGASSWVHCGAANRQVQDERLAQAEATGAGILVTACPKCQIHLKCTQQSRNGKKPKIDIQDLAGLAAGSLDQEAG
jgi:heterodisulfide reductase subunit D